MKKKIALILMGLLLTSGTIQAQSLSSEDINTLTVSANAVKEVTPDTVEVNIEVQTENTKSMQVAMNENNRISQEVLSGLNEVIDKKNGDYVKTSDFGADSLYVYNGSKRTFDKYQVTNMVVVHTKSIDKIPVIIEKAIKLGASGVSNLNFSVSNYEQYREELLTCAIKKAEKQAKVAATASGVTIKNVKDITIINSENGYARTRYAAVNLKADMASGAGLEGVTTPSIEPGVIKIQADVKITYAIK